MSVRPGNSWPTIRPTRLVRGTDGFTLVELLLVILLLGILARVAFTSYSGMVSEVKLDAAAREIQGALLYARNLSSASNVTPLTAYGVRFTPPQVGIDNGNWFQCIQATGTPTPLGITHPVHKRPYKLDFDEDGYLRGITLANVSLDAQRQVFFDPQGTPTVSGSVTVQYGGLSRIITVNRPSGRVTIQ